jgi:hypothetical protein
MTVSKTALYKHQLSAAKAVSQARTGPLLQVIGHCRQQAKPGQQH